VFAIPLSLATALALLATVAAVLVAGCEKNSEPAMGQVDTARLMRSDAEPQWWLTNGRDWRGTYYSPLTRIDASNVKRLGFAWQYALGTRRGLQATPIVVDGVMYFSGNWGRVYALDAASGRELWTFTPLVDSQYARYACCDVVNRGLAVWRGRVYVAAIDGWLYALDARNGSVVWRADTFAERGNGKHYTATGAPQIAHNVVVVGNGGADFGVRGYVTALDLGTGAFRWRFFTVPGDPRLGFEHPELEMAARTWDPNSRWDLGGGGTAWDAMAYDPGLNLLYVGTGNGSPYKWRERSPGGGDNLVLASILAIDPDTGRLAWYYQQVPGENWDYTATQKMILADLEIDGVQRQTLLQAPKNGLFYVLDRKSGQLISAKPYTSVNWTSGVDGETGRPVPNPKTSYDGAQALVAPGMAGGHNWQPMSFNPRTGLVYLPVIDTAQVFIDIAGSEMRQIDASFDVVPVYAPGYKPQTLSRLAGRTLPSLDSLHAQALGRKDFAGLLRAWDPVAQRIVWEQQTPFLWDGGVMSTAGNLVVQGRSTGELAIYAADDGRLLNVIDVGTSIMAAPMSYEVAGEQYLAVLAGYGGSAMIFDTFTAAYEYGNEGRVVVFRLGGGTVPKPATVESQPFPEPPPRPDDEKLVRRGEILFTRHCLRCHYMADRTLLPDLRRLSLERHAIFDDIVLRGILSPRGMARFDDLLSVDDAHAIHAFVIDEGWTARHNETRPVTLAAPGR
jgi:quinohemoprotein ethanol dehydrogenase